VPAEKRLEAAAAKATMKLTKGTLKALLAYVAVPPARGYFVTNSA
jgi:hypothetical protein